MGKFSFKAGLRLFDGPSGTGAPGNTAGEGNGAPGEAMKAPENTRRGKTGDKVVYGKQEAHSLEETNKNHGAKQGSDAGSRESVSLTSDTLEEKRKAFRELVEGEYKDMYTEDTQRIIDRRFRETKILEERLSKSQPVLDLLMQRYKIQDGDLSKLEKALEEDDAYWLEAADEAGLTVEQYKTMQRLQRENQELNKTIRQARNQQEAQEQLQRWYTEGEGVKVVYPAFDLQAEAQNPQFLSLLKAGVPVQHAYEVIHMDDIKSGIVEAVAQRTEKRVVDSILAKGHRPQENGISAQGGFTIKEDPSKWTKEDRAEIARRVARGETIML